MITITEGVISNLVLILLIILISTGWFHSLVNDIGSKRRIILFLLLTYILFAFEYPLLGWTINFGGFLIPFAAYFILLFQFVNRGRIHLFTATLLLGATYFLIKELIRLDPIILVSKELYEITAILVLIILVVVTDIKNRIALIFGGTILGELIFNVHHKGSFGEITLGDGGLQDIIWVSLFEILIIHYTFLAIKNWLKRKGVTNFLKIKVDK